MDIVVYVVENWDVVTLLVTNLVALYVKSPLQGRRKGDVL